MKKAFLLFFLMIMVFNGCYSTALIEVPYVEKNFTINEIKEATVGSPIIDIESGTRAEAKENGKELTNLQLSMQKYFNNGFAQELVYNGITNGIIYITYREYTIKSGARYIRDSYTEKLQYEIKGDSIISFMNTQIKVLKADSNKIVYQVISSGK